MMMVYQLLACILLISGCAHQERSPAQFQQTDEVLVNVGVPLKSIEREVAKLAKTSSVIKQIDYIGLDPETRILSIKGTIHYALDGLLNFGTQTPTDVPSDHLFELAVSFPAASELSQIRYFRLKFHRFKINGDDYLNAFSIVASFIQAVMANSDLIHYVYDQASAQIKNADTITMMKEIIESNGFLVNQTLRIISVKLNLNYFNQFKIYEEVKDLRLWYFGPDLLGGTQNYKVFRIIAGIGKPSDHWVNQYVSDVERDNKTLAEVKNELFGQFSNHQQAFKAIEDYFNELLESEKIEQAKLKANYQREISDFLRMVGNEARERLTVENEIFQADPENEYLNFIQDKKSESRAFFADLDRRLTIDDLNKKGADPENKHLPFITKRVGQDLLNSSMNFVRDMEVDGQHYIKEAHMILSPGIPGIIMRGRLNVDINYILGKMNSGFIGKKIDGKALQINEGLPFEMVLETKMGNKGWLGIDPKSITFLEGERKMAFNRTSANHQFFLDFIKLYLAQSLAAMSFDMTEDTEDPIAKKARKLKEMIEYVKAIQTSYPAMPGTSVSDELIRAMTFDLEKNPFATAGEKYIRKKGEILFSNLISLDPDQKMFKIKLDPAMVIDNQGIVDTLQVWNLAPLYSKDLNNTFLEMSVGNGPRGRRFVDGLSEREQDIDQTGFSGLYNDHDRSAVDLLISLNFHYLETYVNMLLRAMINQQNAQYEKELTLEKEQSHTIIDNVTMKIGMDKTIQLNLKATVIAKKKKILGGFWSAEKWKISRDSYSISSEVELQQRNLKQIKSQLRDDKLPIYFNHEAIGVQLNKAKIEFGKPSLINSALSSLLSLNKDTALGVKFRSLILRVVSMYFNSQYKPSSEKTLAGHDIEEMVKVLTTNDEIILLINPRLAGPAFELKLTGKEKFLEKALKIGTKGQEVHLAFTAATSMAKIDRRELLNIIQDSGRLITPYLKITDGNVLAAELNKNLLVDKLIMASDKSKISVYNRFLATLRNYDQVLNIVNVPFQAKNNDQRVTSCGVELMQFASSGFVLQKNLDKMIDKIISLKVEGKVNYFKTLVEAWDKLKDNVWNPLLSKYLSSHHMLNQQLVKNPNTFWTYQFYADAFFAEKVFLALKKID